MVEVYNIHVDARTNGLVLTQNGELIFVPHSYIPALCRALHEAAGLPWPEGVRSENAGDGESIGQKRQISAGLTPDLVSEGITPAEDRDWVPGFVHVSGISIHNPPDLAGLKAALEGLREEWKDGGEGLLRAAVAVLDEAERAGLLTEERPVDAVEQIAQMLWHRFAPDSHIEWEEEGEKAIYRGAAGDILAALKGRGE